MNDNTINEPAPRPVIGLPACRVMHNDMPFHKVGDKYVRAVAVSAGAIPLTIPALGDLIDCKQIVAQLDGLLLTGSPSTVHPTLYGQEESERAAPFDRERDETTFPLIEAALEDGLPLLAICRGFQELNAALGGTLHPRLQEVEGRLDHRRPQHPDLDVQYGPKHGLTLKPGSQFARLFGCESMEVNSLHGQGIDRLADGLEAEAWAPDGTIEAITVKDAQSFAMAVQWHPEYKAWESDHATRLLKAFGDAARARASARNAGPFRTLGENFENEGAPVTYS